jgi:hypothetical protein
MVRSIVATTSELQDDNTWSWPCPYCGQANALDAVSCAHCGVQLRDPDEDELFTTVATDNAQVVPRDGPRVRESLWSTDAAEFDDGVVDAEPVEPDAPRVHVGPVSTGAGTAPLGGTGGPSLFSAEAIRPTSVPEPPTAGASLFGAEARRQAEGGIGEPGARPAFGVPGQVASPPPQPPAAPASPPTGAAPVPPPSWTPPMGAHASTAPPGEPVSADPFAHTAAPRATPDPHGLSVAVESLPPSDRERCAVPIGVCGALLVDQEVVLGVVTGHLLGHPAVVVLTNARVLVANARRWTPLVDVFQPGPELVVHTRHDRDVAALTFVQGASLTSIDDITDVASALDLAERIRAIGAARGTY